MRQSEQSQSFTLDGTRFTVGKLTPRRAVRMAIRLGRILGPGIGGAMSKLDFSKGLKGLGEADVAQLAAQFDFVKAISEVVDRVTVEEFDSIHDEFLWNAQAEVDGKTLQLIENFDTVFDARPFLSFQVLGKAMAFSYGNFSKLLATVGSSSVTPETVRQSA